MEIIPIAPPPKQDFSPPATSSHSANNNSPFESVFSDAVNETRDSRHTSNDGKNNRSAHSDIDESDRTKQAVEGKSSEQTTKTNAPEELESGKQDTLENGKQVSERPEHLNAGDGDESDQRIVGRELINTYFSSENETQRYQLPPSSLKAIEQQLLNGAFLHGRFAERANMFPGNASLFQQQILASDPSAQGQVSTDFLTLIVENAPQTNNKQQSGGQQASLMLERLQNLISQNNDRVSITASFQNQSKQEFPGLLHSPVLTAGQEPITDSANLRTEGKQNGISVAAENMVQQHKPEMPALTLRQEIMARLSEQKPAAAQTQQESQQNSERNGGESTQQNTGFQQQTLLSNMNNTMQQSPDLAGHQHGFSGQFQNVSLQHTMDGPKAATGSHDMQQSQFIREDHVINQVIERFSIRSAIQTSRLSLKLHPAELGELKIDMVVKQDSLKANIFAHTQQAQQIIEKNLPRLRAILEDQGMTVEDLVVTLESDSVDDFNSQNSNLFEDHMSGFRENSSKPSTNTANVSFEDSVTDQMSKAANGVNLTV